MNEKLNESLEEIALLAVMLNSGDSQGMIMVFELIQGLVDLAAGGSELEPFTVAAKALLTLGDDDGEQRLAALNRFISDAQSFLQDTSTNPFAAGADAPSGWGDDLSPHADQELIIEFIEKHTLMMDDFEAALLHVAHVESASTEEIDEFRRFVKGYLHNIKGDAGSVGLTGIERATHAIEDLLINTPAEVIVEELLSYREWVLAEIQAYSSGESPSVLSGEIVQKITDSVTALHGGTKAVESSEPETTTHSTPEPVVEEVAPKEAEAPKAPASYKISGDVELLSEFLAEAEEHLGAIESLLLEKESGYNQEDLDTVFRAMHSIKGGSSYFNLKEMTMTSHAAENLMDKARNGQLVFNTALKTIALRYIDIERNLLEAAKEAQQNDGVLTPLSDCAAFMETVSDYLRSIAMIEEISLPDVAMLSGDSESAAKAAPQVSETEPAQTLVVEPAKASESKPTAKPVQKQESLMAEKEESSSRSKKAEVKSFVKIETKRLDHLLEYIGEMVISSSMLIKNCRDHLGHDEGVMSNSNQLERISREIQEIGMSMRLIEVKGLFQKMSRIVWDTGKKLKKDVRFEMEGEDTELDRTVIEKLSDPLMHMVRNAVDHGVETPEEREAAGKTPFGTVRLSAFHQSGSIFIKITDDGKGLDPQKLVSHAINKGILEEHQELSDEEAFMLIFAAGFSTAKTITDVSGRGVGMDVVRKNIESMRGRVSIESELGKGSTFTIQLPLTLAIMEGIETSIGDERFIVPSLSIVEFLKPSADMIMRTLDRGETLKFRGLFLPIFRISELYQIDTERKDPTDCILVVVESGDSLVALMVDEVLGKFSAVIKSLGSMFKEVLGLAGCAIMPNGSIGLILDVPTLVGLGKNLPENLPSASTKLPSGATLSAALTQGNGLH